MWNYLITLRIHVTHTLKQRKQENSVGMTKSLNKVFKCLLFFLFSFALRHMAKTPPCLLLPGLCVGVCSLLGYHATGRLGELCPGALRDLLHTGLVACAGLCVRPELCLNYSVLLSHLPHLHYCLFLCHDHLQGQILHKGGLALWHPH